MNDDEAGDGGISRRRFVVHAFAAVAALPVLAAAGTGEAGERPDDGLRKTETSTATVTLESGIRVRGSSMSHSSIRAVVSHNLPALRGCYATGLAGNARLRGHVNATLSVNANGSIAGVSAHGARPDLETVASCFQQAMHGWTFPAQASGASSQVELKFRLGPRPEPVYIERMGMCKPSEELRPGRRM